MAPTRRSARLSKSPATTEAPKEDPPVKPKKTSLKKPQPKKAAATKAKTKKPLAVQTKVVSKTNLSSKKVVFVEACKQ